MQQPEEDKHSSGCVVFMAQGATMHAVSTKTSWILGLAAGVSLSLALLVPANEPAAVGFEKRVLTPRYYCDGINAGDFNRDGKLDIVAGPFWYAGPAFSKAHEFYAAVALEPEKSPSNSMFSYVYDFNGDGWPDILVLGRVHMHEAYWYENPRLPLTPPTPPGGEGRVRGGGGKETLWKKHFVFERIKGESPPFVDINQDGKPELICHHEGRWGWLEPNWKEPAKPWSFHPITAAGDYNQFYHGTGVGDINGDGRLDLLLNDGWWEQPPPDAPLTPPSLPGGEGRVREWKAHPHKLAKRGGAQILVYDVDGDGDNDLVSSIDAHGWGVAWFEQVRDNDKITFKQHTIMGDRSEEKQYGVAFTQPHALAMADVDGDGLLDVVTGKRRWAHGPTGDIEPSADPVVYWFRLIRAGGKVRFEPHKIDDRSGVGTQIVAADVNGDGRVDLLTASKLGSFLFVNRRSGPR